MQLLRNWQQLSILVCCLTSAMNQRNAKSITYFFYFCLKSIPRAVTQIIYSIYSTQTAGHSAVETALEYHKIEKLFISSYSTNCC